MYELKYVTNGLYPEKVFKNFEDISKIPRGSGNEKAISDYIVELAKKNKLFVRQDEHNNVVVKKKATNDSKNTVMLQAHIDMVTEAGEGSNHDFIVDPIELIIEGNKLRANNTTLGADNGIGVAYMMSIIESSDISHPNLELIFTADEEVGLVGVTKLDFSDLESSYVLNLDSEEEDFILVGCAGAVDSIVSLKKEYKPSIPSNIALEINVKGLTGGHSGMDIDKERGNSNVILGRILSSITYDFDLFAINGGSKRNVIPRKSEAVISVNPDVLENIVKEIQKISAKIQKEQYTADPNLKIELRRSAPTSFKVFTEDCKSKIIGLMLLIPNGVISRSTTIENCVETSTNFAIINETSTSIEFLNLTRSSMQSKKDYVTTLIETAAKSFNAKVEITPGYPAWEHNANSSLEKISVDIYSRLFSKKPEVVVMHCGLESGILLSKLKQKAESISIGPNTFNVHSPDEYVEISSVGKIWDYLIEILKNL
ncbi:beta-Ala-His dipeptidase [Peptostreptococcus sp. D1]|uniref:beta-Ala-His dipeptidase n=1 Tax=Peptostreptococcus sp. D1 TaxID=72304 RepID=UPI001FA897FE